MLTSLRFVVIHKSTAASASAHLRFAHATLRWQEQIRPAPLITGNDLIVAGYKPGPLFKELLAAVEDAQLDGSIHTKEEAMGLVRGKMEQT